jgi:hypothetical protein
MKYHSPSILISPLTPKTKNTPSPISPLLRLLFLQLLLLLLLRTLSLMIIMMQDRFPIFILPTGPNTQDTASAARARGR